MFFRDQEAGWRARGADAETAAGMARLDNIAMLPLDAPDDRIGNALSARG